VVAWLSAPVTDEARCVARMLDVAGYDVEWMTPGCLPGRSPAVIVVFDDGKESWTSLAAVAASGRAPVLYWGNRAPEARRRLPELSAALPTPIRGLEMRMVLEMLGLPWGHARVPGAHPRAPTARDDDAARLPDTVVERRLA
jgi:hypothetical protein